jgi:hypothetical protein
MQKLLSSDVLYSDRVAPLIIEALANAGLAGSPPPSAFLPDLGWLTPQTVAARILTYVPTSLGGAPLPSGATVGHQLVSVGYLTPTGTVTPLQSHGVNRIAYTTAGVTFVLVVENSGTVQEHNVGTEITFFKAGLDTACLKRTTVIRTTAPGVSYSPSILFTPTCPNLQPYLNQTLAMTASVDALPGETVTSNNKMSFDIDFTS